MRIVFLGTRGFPNVQGGVENHCENLAVNLVQLGCEVVVFTRKPYVDKNLKEYKGVKLVMLPTIKNKWLEAFFHTFIGIIASVIFKADIIHIQGIGPGMFAPLAKILGKRVVLTTHGSNYKHIKWGWLAKKILKLGECLAVSFSDEVIAISNNIAHEIEEKYKRRVHYIPNGVSFIEPAKSTGILNDLKIQKDKYILAVGRIVPEKGFHDLVETFIGLELKGWKLIIAGKADFVSKYSTELFKRAESNKNIIFTGLLTGLPLYELYSHAGLFILPSYYEGLPIALLEAMSFGLSCIVSDIPGNKSVSLPGMNYFQAGNSIELGRKILHFLNQPEDKSELNNRMERIKVIYNWNKLAEETLEVYNILLSGSKIVQ